jgi:hypothetical protein
MPLGLSDEEVDALMAISAPVPVELRDPFLRALVQQLEKFPEIGPGLIHRLGRELQREFCRPDVAVGPARRAYGVSKYSRPQARRRATGTGVAGTLK